MAPRHAGPRLPGSPSELASLRAERPGGPIAGEDGRRTRPRGHGRDPRRGCLAPVLRRHRRRAPAAPDGRLGRRVACRNEPGSEASTAGVPSAMPRSFRVGAAGGDLSSGPVGSPGGQPLVALDLASIRRDTAAARDPRQGVPKGVEWRRHASGVRRPAAWAPTHSVRGSLGDADPCTWLLRTRSHESLSRFRLRDSDALKTACPDLPGTLSRRDAVAPIRPLARPSG